MSIEHSSTVCTLLVDLISELPNANTDIASDSKAQAHLFTTLAQCGSPNASQHGAVTQQFINS